MIKDPKEFERTMIAIDNSTLDELLAWKDHLDDDASYYGEHYDERIYNVILEAIKTRQEQKREQEVRNNEIKSIVQNVFDELIAKGYSPSETKLFGDTLSLLAVNYEKENKKSNVK